MKQKVSILIQELLFNINFLKSLGLILIIFFTYSNSTFAGVPHYVDFKFILNQSDAGKKAQSYLKNKLNNGLCEYCKERKASETHHMQYQEMANDNNYITHFHKNHVANLIHLCEECHNEIHKKNIILVFLMLL